MSLSEFSRETPASGVVVFQPRRGFRYGAEAFWLTGFALEGGTGQSALDLGTGSGIVALLLGALGWDVRGVDHRVEWRTLWERSLAESQCVGRIQLELSDIGQAALRESVDLVVSNPPFFPAGSGPISPDPWKAAARTETSADLMRFLDVALSAISPEGRACFVLPTERLTTVRRFASNHRVVLRRSVLVGRRRVLVELANEGQPTSIEEIDEEHPRAKAWYAAATARG